jgi:two-component system cell cycle response regulator
VRVAAFSFQQRIRSANGDDGLKALQAARAPDAPHLLMLDWVMPGMQGPDVCRQLRQDPGERYRYIMLLTAKDNKADIIAGLEAGADDYLTKPFDTHELLARVRVGTRMLKLQESLLLAQEKLRFQATHDPLTGVWNRGALFDLLRGEVERAQRKATGISLLMLDVDHFKRINDSFGHPVGDLVLQEVARRLLASMRSYDIVGRYGGEEFLVVASDLEQESPLEFGERLRRTVFSAPVETPSAAVSVSVSIGVTSAQPGLQYSIEDLIHASDSALYTAKNNGRNRVEAQSINHSLDRGQDASATSSPSAAWASASTPEPATSAQR